MPLKVENIYSGYLSDINVLRGVSLNIEDKKATVVLGPNGSGKSTLLKTIYGYLKPIRGRITLNGINLVGKKPHEMPKIGIGYVSQERGIFPHLTVEENLKTGLWIMHSDKQLIKDKLDEIYGRFPILYKRRKDKANILSGGQQRILQIAKSIITNPEVLLLDEPSTGLSPLAVEEVFKIIRTLKEEGKTILLVEQNVRKALTIADYVYVIELGQNKVSGTKAEIEKNMDEILGIWGFRK